MSTFIGQLIGFAVIVFLLWKYVVPPVRTMMKNQQDTVRNQLADSAEAQKKVADADTEHAKAVEEAEAEGERVVEEAKQDSERITEQLRAQADAELERIKVQGAAQVRLLRQQLIRELRQTLGTESVRRSGDLVRNFVSDPSEQSATVDRFLAELDEMAPSNAVFDDPVTAKMRAASRHALTAVVTEFDSVSGGLDVDGLTKLGSDLASVAKLLDKEAVLARHLADPSSEAEPRATLAGNLLSGKVSDQALDVVKAAASQRWSSSADLVHGIKHVARLALLVRAERDGQAEELEEQLFRFSRILDSEPRLISVLGDYSTPVDGRVGLLTNVLHGRANRNTADLLRQTVEFLHGERADEVVHELAELAVSRRGEVVAQVHAAADLTDAQRSRLTELLTRIYGHPVSVQLDIDPALLGGLTIAVGDEVIDGSLASKLAAAETHLPD
jgi:ATP synthase F0 subunit b/ATP synthase F1 delta subunit